MDSLFAVVLAVIPALLNIGILLYLLLFLPKGKVTTLFGLFLVALIMWQTEDAISRLVTDVEKIQFWDRVLCIGWIGVGPLIFHFIAVFTGNKKLQSTFALFLLYVPFVIFYILYVANITPAEYRHHEFWGWLRSARPGTTDMVQRHYIAIVVMAGLILLFRFIFRHRNNSRRKKQALLIAIGILIPTIQGTLTQVIFPSYLNMEVPLTSTFMTFLSVAFIVAMSRYHLFDVSDSLEVKGVLDNLNNIVVVIAPNEKIIYCNPYAQQTLKLKEDPQLSDLFEGDPEAITSFRNEVLTPSLEGQVLHDYETRFACPGNRYMDVLLSIEVVRNNALVQGVLLIANDISERKKHLQTLETQNRKMRAIAWTQSHIVRAPVARILALVDIIQINGLNHHETADMLSYISDSARELDDVIHNIVEKTREVELKSVNSDNKSSPGTK